jgi:hypothetical protein
LPVNHGRLDKAEAIDAMGTLMAKHSRANSSIKLSAGARVRGGLRFDEVGSIY